MEEIKFDSSPRCPGCNKIIDKAAMPHGYKSAMQQVEKTVLALTVCMNCANILILKGNDFKLLTDEVLSILPDHVITSIKAAKEWVKQRNKIKNN